MSDTVRRTSRTLSFEAHDELTERIERVRHELSIGSERPTLASVLRQAIAIGLPVIEAEAGRRGRLLDREIAREGGQ